MSIIVQIKTILFSIFFGVLFSFVVGLNYKYIVGKGIFSFVLSFMLVLVMTLFYFIILRYINFGVFHYIELLSIIFGFIVENLVFGIVEKRLKKWYTLFSKVGEYMARRKSKKSKRRLAIFGTLSLFVIGYFIFNLCYYSYRIMVLEKSKAHLQGELTSLQKKEEMLTSDIQKLKDPEYIAKFARENYMYSRDGEYIIKIEDDNIINDSEKDSFDYKYLIYASAGCFALVIIYIVKKKNSD